MKKILSILFIALSFILNGQTSKNIEKIIQLGDAWKFDEAIDSLKHYISIDPENPELYYWLGRYAHYKVSDSRPYPGKGDQWSREEVLKPLQKAVELNPNYGDAKYFLAAEYGARAMEALRRGDVAQYKQELLDAKSWGGFPVHAIEQGRNVLKSCDTNAILIVDGDAYTNILQYLQVIEGYRKDVSVLVMTDLGRPYYIKLIRDRVPGIFKSVPIDMNDNLIMEMRDYKWRENDITISVSAQTREIYNLDDSVKHFIWHVKPNIGKGALSPATAMLINIMESNQWKRPISCIFSVINEIDGLADNMQIQGLTAKLYPVKVWGTEKEYDSVKFVSIMLNPENYKDYADIALNNQARVSNGFGQLSRGIIMNYAFHLVSKGDNEGANEVINQLMVLMPPEVFPFSSSIQAGIDRLKLMTKKKLSDLIQDGKPIDGIVRIIETEKPEDSEYDLSDVGIYRLGLGLMDEGKNEEALKIFEAGIELYPDVFFLYEGYGECLMLLGQKEKALEAYKKSLELNPDNTNAAEFIKNNQ